jgi:hypothetical protein
MSFVTERFDIKRNNSSSDLPIHSFTDQLSQQRFSQRFAQSIYHFTGWLNIGSKSSSDYLPSNSLSSELSRFVSCSEIIEYLGCEVVSKDMSCASLGI